MELRKLTVEGFINETASSSPAPGGGSIAALNASSSAALIAMVANLTLGKEKYAAVEGDMKDVAAKATALKDDFLALIDEDSNAFNKIMAAFKLPKDRTKPRKPGARPSRKPPRAQPWCPSRWARKPTSCLLWRKP